MSIYIFISRLFNKLKSAASRIFTNNRRPTTDLDKRAFLVIGPESHGTHLITDILINAGCIGHAGNHVSWQPNNKKLIKGIKKPWEYLFPTDLQPWDRNLPTDEDPIVWRRSIPHGKRWVEISEMIEALEKRGYAVQVIVVTRDTYSAIHSQLKWQHVKNEEKGKANIARAYFHIFRHLIHLRTKYLLVSYESLAHYPKAQDYMLQQLGLELPKRRWPIYDGNRKWHDLDTKEQLVSFPEAWYPPTNNQATYFEQVANGYKRMAGKKVVICGLARDIDHALANMKARIERLGQFFEDYQVIIYENDSVDGTLEHLRYWEKVNPKVHVLSDQLSTKKWGQVQNLERMEQMAFYRNQYLNAIKDQSLQFDYLIVLDFDIPLGFSYDGIAHSFSHDHWDIMASNGILVPPYGDPIADPLFFDAFAFRQIGQTEASNLEAVNQLRFERGADLVAVDSAFGGLAIYTNKAILAGASYGGGDCEHVVFHRRLRKKGLTRLFLNPNQLVLYSGRS